MAATILVVTKQEDTPTYSTEGRGKGNWKKDGDFVEKMNHITCLLEAIRFPS